MGAGPSLKVDPDAFLERCLRDQCLTLRGHDQIQPGALLAGGDHQLQRPDQRNKPAGKADGRGRSDKQGGLAWPKSTRSSSPPWRMRSLWRARSTRMRRMASVAAAKKWPRLFHDCGCFDPASLSHASCTKAVA